MSKQKLEPTTEQERANWLRWVTPITSSDDEQVVRLIADVERLTNELEKARAEVKSLKDHLHKPWVEV